METLENRREKMCLKLIKDMKEPVHKLNDLLPPMYRRETRDLIEINSIILNVEQNALVIIH